MSEGREKFATEYFKNHPEEREKFAINFVKPPFENLAFWGGWEVGDYLPKIFPEVKVKEISADTLEKVSKIIFRKRVDLNSLINYFESVDCVDEITHMYNQGCYGGEELTSEEVKSIKEVYEYEYG